MGRGIEQRRAFTDRIAARRWKLRMRVSFRGDEPDEDGPTKHFFDKRTALGCNCSRKRHGRPKVSGGMCAIGKLEDTIHDRQRTRALRQQTRNRDVDWDGDDIP